MNCSLDSIKLLKSGCLEVDALKSESECAIKELAEVQSKLLHSKRDQIECFRIVGALGVKLPFQL